MSLGAQVGISQPGEKPKLSSQGGALAISMAISDLDVTDERLLRFYERQTPHFLSRFVFPGSVVVT